MKELWNIAKALIEKDYGTAFVLNATWIKQLQTDAEKNGPTLKLVEVLNKVLREHHILNDIKEAYSSIELPKIKALLGFSSESDATLTSFLTARGFKVEGNFVTIPPNIDDTSSNAKRFKLDQGKI